MEEILLSKTASVKLIAYYEDPLLFWLYRLYTPKNGRKIESCVRLYEHDGFLSVDNDFSDVYGAVDFGLMRKYMELIQSRNGNRVSLNDVPAVVKKAYLQEFLPIEVVYDEQVLPEFIQDSIIVQSKTALKEYVYRTKLIAEETCTDLEVVSCMREWLSLWEIEELIHSLKRIKQRNNGEAHLTSLDELLGTNKWLLWLKPSRPEILVEYLTK